MSHYPLDPVLAAILIVPALSGPLLLRLANRAWIAEESTTHETTHNKSSKTFSVRLTTQLLSLSVPAYERLIAAILRATGYEDVQILRDHRIRRRSHKGRNKHGGVDLTALSRTELDSVPILVQVKQYQRPVSRRFVDELRGALLRRQARHALLITTSTFAPAARRAAREDHIGPVQLIDGRQLQQLLMRHYLGVRQNHRGDWVLDLQFFRNLEQEGT